MHTECRENTAGCSRKWKISTIAVLVAELLLCIPALFITVVYIRDEYFLKSLTKANETNGNETTEAVSNETITETSFCEHVTNAFGSGCVFWVVVCLTGTVITVLAILGAHLEKQCLLVPYIVYGVIGTILSPVICVLVCVVVPFSITLFMIFAIIVFIGAAIYVWNYYIFLDTYVPFVSLKSDQGQAASSQKPIVREQGAAGSSHQDDKGDSPRMYPSITDSS